jgi:NAD-dependent SIR2 family protein deacetylase
MRFLKNGLDIPDKLLHDRDAGRVVLFCGAGVSQEAARLPDFPSLLEKVKNALYAHCDPAHGKQEAERGLCNLTIDQQFTWLERRFPRELIEDHVLRLLQPDSNIQTDVHKTLVDLAKARDGRLRLITSNFDHLFDPHTKNTKGICPQNCRISNKTMTLTESFSCTDAFRTPMIVLPLPR